MCLGESGVIKRTKKIVAGVPHELKKEEPVQEDMTTHGMSCEKIKPLETVSLP